MRDVAEFGSNLVIPTDAPGVAVVTGDPASEAILGRIATDLQAARLGTLLLHVDRDRAPDRGVASVRDDLPAVVRGLAEDERTRGLDCGVVALGAAAGVALRVAAEEPGLVSALVCYEGAFDGVEAAARTVVPTMLLIEDERLEEANQAVLDHLQGPKELQVLRAVRRADEERLERMVTATAAWLGHHLTTRGDYPRTP